jgi:hypothetical protein
MHSLFKIIALVILYLFLNDSFVFAQSIKIDANKIQYKPEVSFSPRSASFTQGSTFEIPILLNTKGKSINGVEVRITYDKDRLSIVKPSSGTSIVGVWVEPPKYDNENGTASFVGVIPAGIVTDSGLIGSITFKALKTGRASISINSTSNLLLNDGLGTQVSFDSIPASYTIIPKMSDGIRVYSETHPFQDEWYRSPNPVILWEANGATEGYSYEFDNKPNTIPDNTIDTKENIKSFEKLSDGLWYFHIKPINSGISGNTTHFVLRIDSTPPAEFKPESNYVLAAVGFVERTLITFFTTDNLSGIDHYEVGIIDKSQPVTVSPVFVQTESPYQVPIKSGSNLHVIVRAIDKAGNIRDSSIDVKPPLVITKIIKQYLVYILIAIILIGFVALIMHYIFGHHIIRYIKEVIKKVKDEENKVYIGNNQTNSQTKDQTSQNNDINQDNQTKV